MRGRNAVICLGWLMLLASEAWLHHARITDVRTGYSSEITLASLILNLPGAFLCRSVGLHPVSDGYVGYYPLPLLLAQLLTNGLLWSFVCVAAPYARGVARRIS